MALRSSTGAAQPEAGRTVTIDPALPRKAAAEMLGTGLLVFFGCGVATVTFGYRAFGSSFAAGVIASSLAFGIVMAALVALIGPISGSHVNPAVTLGAFLSRRISIIDAVGYWVAQFIGGILGALLLLWVMHTVPGYTRAKVGLAANGWGTSPASVLGVSGAGAFLIEVIITAVFVLVVLSATRKEANVAVSGAVIGLGLLLANLVATPIDGASVNPARSFGPALVTAGQPIRQVWLFLLAPLVGAVLAAGVYLLFHPWRESEAGARTRFSREWGQSPVSAAGAEEGTRPAGVSSTTASGTAAGAGAPAPGGQAPGGQAPGGQAPRGSGTAGGPGNPPPGPPPPGSPPRGGSPGGPQPPDRGR
jgi:aquaporin Z